MSSSVRSLMVVLCRLSVRATGPSVRRACQGLAVVAMLTVLTAAPVLATGSSGSTLTLGQLIGKCLTIGDKKFYFDSFCSDNLSACNIKLVTINEGADAIGFNLIGQASADQSWCGSGGGITASFTLKYHVVVQDANQLIKDADLALTLGTNCDQQPQPACTTPGGGGSLCSATVEETIKAGLGKPKLQVSVSGTQGQDTDSVDFTPVKTVSVVKKFELTCDPGSAWNSLQSYGKSGSYGDKNKVDFCIQQTFSQIPEPSTTATIGLALCALLPLLRRRR